MAVYTLKNPNDLQGITSKVIERLGISDPGGSNYRSYIGKISDYLNTGQLGNLNPSVATTIQQTVSEYQGLPTAPQTSQEKQFQSMQQTAGAIGQQPQQFQTAIQPQQQQNNTTQALSQNIQPHPDAPQGYGVDITTGRFAKLPTTETTKQQQPQPSRAELQQNVLGTLGGKTANQNFVNAVFKAFHGRDATRDELGIYTGQTVDTVRNTIIGGARAAGLPTGPTQPAGIQQPIQPFAPTIEQPFTVGGIDIAALEKRLGIPGLATEEKKQRDALVAAHNALPSRLSLLEQETRKQGLGTIADSIAGIQKMVQDQQNSLRDLPGAVKERAAPFKVTASQLARMTATEREPMARALADLLTSQNILEQQWTRKHQLAKDAAEAGEFDAQKALKGIQLQLGFIQEDKKKAEKYLEILVNAAQKELDRTAKTAEEKRDNEATAMRDLGLVRNPTTGKLEPTLAARREGRLTRGGGGAGGGTAPIPSQFTIRAGLAGLTKQQQNDVFQLPTPPPWFRQKEESKSSQSLTQEELQRRWGALRAGAEKAAEPTESSFFDDL